MSTNPARINFAFDRHDDLNDYLRTTPSGRDMWTLARSMGILTRDLDGSAAAFVANIAELGPNQLSDLQSKWTSEYGRLAGIAGLLVTQEKHLTLELGRARAEARRRARATARSDAENAHAAEVEAAKESGAKVAPLKYKDPTIAELNDLAAEDPAVTDIETQVVSVQMMLAMTLATKDAVEKYLSGVSREITWRSAQMQARM